MSSTEMTRTFVRSHHADLSRLAWALVISILFHLLVFGTYETGRKFNWWEKWRSPAWMRSAKLLTQLLKKPDARKKAAEAEPPLVFVEVTPSQASAEPPKNAKYYSDKNSTAANPNADKDTGIPKIEGTQEHVAKTEDVPKADFKPLQPALPVEPVTPRREELNPVTAPPVKPRFDQVQPDTTQPPGDLAFARQPDREPNQRPAAPRRRPTVEQALAAMQRPAAQIPGTKMKQEGGARAHIGPTSLDVQASPYGAYDAALIAAISQRWYSLLDDRDYASDSRGKVVLHFILHYDGRITDMTVAENTAGEMLALLCEKAVLDPAPFAPWSSQMRRLLGESRNIRFTFYYD